ncbi:unnamed protein product [Ciceribacter sp. T2.26MG-112.2]|nr:unnamed protein product [Ciceribacter naphthalenivorans]
MPGHVRLRSAIQRGGPYRPSIGKCRAKRPRRPQKIERPGLTHRRQFILWDKTHADYSAADRTDP